MTHDILVTCSKGLEYLLEEELQPWGLTGVKVSPRGVAGKASLETIYMITLWSRIANRVLVHLFSGPAEDAQALHATARQFDWARMFFSQPTVAIHFQGQSETIRNAMYGAQVIKDGWVDYCRDQGLERPSIERVDPDLRLRAYLQRDRIAVYLDVVGYSLHQRGYRLAAGQAPLKETVAAALLIRAKWPLLSQQGYGFHDPCCGSGTIVIEAAMIAARMAPGLLRNDQAFAAWAAHDAALWSKCREQAAAQQQPYNHCLWGTDSEAQAIHKAEANAERAGVAALTRWAVQPLDPEWVCATQANGLVVTNPPYGERLGEEDELFPLYQQLGLVLQRSFPNWEAAILTSSANLAKAIGLRSHKQYRFYNGPLACHLYCLDLHAHNRLQTDAPLKPYSESAQMFANRLRKNVKHLRSWAQRQHIDCYRVYDADLPEYAFAVDRYRDYVVLQEYAPPATVDLSKAEQRRQEVLRVVPEVLDLPAEKMVFKQRSRQRGTAQYEKLSERRQWQVVSEGRAQLRVNLHDYLDTGLFLDHRLLRLRFAQLAPETRFLNCFCYTATASVHAALAGAVTTNVDMSQTYLSWAQENFKLNQLDLSKQRFIHDDCLEWLQRSQDKFEVIFLDPPSFSNSKRMQQTLDISRDHEQLIRACMRLLTAQGVLYFSTNFRRFQISPAILADFTVKDISTETIDVDFKRNHTIHHCFQVSW